MKNFIAVLALFVITFSARGQGTAFTYQGQLQNNGSPANGSYDLAFTLYNANSGGMAMSGPVMKSATVVSNGLFTTTIEFGSGAFAGISNWLEIAVSTNGANNFTTLAPRQLLAPAPYAVFAEGARAAGLIGTIAAANMANGTITSNLLAAGAVGTNQLTVDIGVWSQSGGNIFYNNGKVGIGTVTPDSPLQVMGLASTNIAMVAGVVQGVQTSGSVAGSGVYGLSLVPGGSGVIGQADGSTDPAVSFPAGVSAYTSATNGAGLYALASAAGGPTRAVYAVDFSAQGYAGYFQGRGYFSGEVGIGTATPDSPLQVMGLASTNIATVAGVVHGVQTSGSISGSGVYGLSLVPGGSGVIGQADGSTDPALSFPAGVSAYTSATNGAGLYAVASAAGGPTRAVYAVDFSPQGYAGYFQGHGYFSTSVGIGTPNPGAELEVRGDVKMGSNGQYFASSSLEKLRIVRGIVRPDGTVFPGSTTNGPGFSISKSGAGTYAITFSPAFADVPSLTITPYTAGSPVTADCTSGSASGFSTITTWIGAAKADNWWNFVAVGGP